MPSKKPDPYASHVPVLQRLLRTIRPRRVLEFGAGMYSTPLYFNDPQLWNVVSVEPDAEWRKEVAHLVDDERLILRPEPTDLTLTHFDLILIDDGETFHHRVRTIRSVLSLDHPPVVIHDAEIPQYADAIKEHATMYTIYETGPDTAVVWR